MPSPGRVVLDPEPLRPSGDRLRPGFSPPRLAALMRAAVARCRLDLDGLVVLTEAASGAYASTAVIAALGGAKRVYAFARATRYGSAAELGAETMALARAAGVEQRIRLLTEPPASVAHEVDIVTNAGALRPIGADLIVRLKDRAVIGLMYEAWEFRSADIDLAACLGRGIPVAAVNERHPRVGVFDYLGPLAVRLLHDAGIPVLGCRLAVLCDNAFAPYIVATLEKLAGEVRLYADPDHVPAEPFDAVLVALQPGRRPVLDAGQARRLVDRVGPVPVLQYWGDIDRPALQSLGVPVWPSHGPAPGHMAVLLSALGPDPVIRLQAGGLRAAELVYRHGDPAAAGGEAEAERLQVAACATMAGAS